MAFQPRSRLKCMFGVVCIGAIVGFCTMAAWSSRRGVWAQAQHNGLRFQETPLQGIQRAPHAENEIPPHSEELAGAEAKSPNDINLNVWKNESKADDSIVTSLLLPPCSLMKRHLVGTLKCDCNRTVEPEEIIELNKDVIKDGRIQPTDCVSKERVAIVIPYRDRYRHLHQLLSMLVPILGRQKVDATIFVVEQVGPYLFNRGALHNVGFLESEKVGKFDCYIFHDVDLVVVNDRHIYSCADKPAHFSVAIKYGGTHHFQEMYSSNFGGVVAFKREQYLAINGNSNLYFGWGGEDDDLYTRVKLHNMTRIRDSPKIARFEMLGHARLNVVLGNPARVPMLKTAKKRMRIDGLNSIQYVVHSMQTKDLYVWVNVTLNMKEMFEIAPLYMKKYIDTMTEFEISRKKNSTTTLKPTSTNTTTITATSTTEVTKTSKINTPQNLINQSPEISGV